MRGAYRIKSASKNLPQGIHGLRTALCTASILAGLAFHPACAQSFVPSGQFITPAADPGSTFQEFNPGLADHPEYRAGQAIKTALSPNGTTLLVLTSGYNDLNYSTNGPNLGAFEPADSTEYVFVYNVTGTHIGNPALQQVIKIPDTFIGLAFSPDGTKFYASGGVDDRIYTYTNGSGGWALTATVPLGHAPTSTQSTASLGFDAGGIGFEQSPSASGLAGFARRIAVGCCQYL